MLGYLKQLFLRVMTIIPMALLGFILLDCLELQAMNKSQVVNGDYEFVAVLKSDADIYFSGNLSFGYRAKLVVRHNQMDLQRVKDTITTTLKSRKCKITYPCKVRILRNGNFYRFWIGNHEDWIRGSLGEWEGVYEPKEAELSITLLNGRYQKFVVRRRQWMTQLANEIIKYGPKGSYYEQQIIPGAILKYNNKYYMYFMAGMAGKEEGSSRRTIGVAVSDNLKDWKVMDKPIVSYVDYPYDNLYINGAVLTPENKIAIMFSAQKFPEWKGFMLATSDSPLGPFVKSAKEPVYKHPYSAHEFDLLDLKENNIRYAGIKYRYMMFYAGYLPPKDGNKGGDRGYILYSNNLQDWIPSKNNPVFVPETADNWDAAHVRPRSLHFIDGYWYLWYEGCNYWNAPETNYDTWCDVIGLARTKDFEKWEYHPRNPVLAGTGVSPSTCGCSWVGWPRMVINGSTGYVFYCGTQDNKVSISCRTIPLNKLVNWKSDYVESNKRK
jgi:predicted GH43/DUF377 family glycosyl hydrolase